MSTRTESAAVGTFLASGSLAPPDGPESETRHPEAPSPAQQARNGIRARGTRSECADCLGVFAGLRPFDGHRVGKYGVDRRCLTTEEMSRSFSKDARGYWTSANGGGGTASP